MSEVSGQAIEETGGILKLPLVASLLALVGLADSVYLTISHYTKEPVPCSIVEGCETVLTSSYAEVAGVPIAAFGAAAYFFAFSLAVAGSAGACGDQAEVTPPSPQPTPPAAQRSTSALSLAASGSGTFRFSTARLA